MSAAGPSIEAGRHRGRSRISISCVLFFAMLTPTVLSAQAAPQTGTTATHDSSQLQSKRQAEMRQRNIDNPEAEDGVNVYRHSPMVRSLARAFGLTVEQTSRLFETVNFILLVILIVWGVAKILPKALRARTERIRLELEQARTATEDANRRLVAVEERLSRLDSDIDAIRSHAEEETVREENRLRDALEQEKHAILASARQDIQAATKNAQSQLKKLAADLVIEHAKQQVSVSAETDRSMVAGFLSSLDDKHPNGGVNG